jgi:hypothetical protein
LAALLLLPLLVAAQGSAPGGAQATPPAGGPSAQELAKQVQNPVASLIVMPLEGNMDMGIGDRQTTGSLLRFQPVMPFAITPNTNVILRVIMPLASVPAPDGTRVNGMGDTVLSAFFSPAKAGPVIWGAGPAFLLPTATNNALGAEKFGVGPSVVALVQPGNWTAGMLFNQIWSVSGAVDRRDVNTALLQPFLQYNLGRGLAVGAVMEATADWKADQRWSSPLLFMVSKVALMGKRPVNYMFGAGPMVASPAGGAGWRFRFSIATLYPR